MNYINEEILQNYLKYLNFIQAKLDKSFEAQKPYIFCKKGCGKCCKNQQFPFSQVEIFNLIIGASKLNPQQQKIAEENINKIIENKKEFEKNNNPRDFYYTCPFLIDDVCSIYEHRGLVCRTFGLMTETDDKSLGVPFCCFEGLNYSNVINKKTKEISMSKFKKLKTDLYPKVYQLRYKQVADNELAKGFGFQFGEIKPMIEWIETLKILTDY